MPVLFLNVDVLRFFASSVLHEGSRQLVLGHLKIYML
jgi:hypothetical protein